MVNKNIFLIFLMGTSLAYANGTTMEQSQQQQPYDADLFNKDKAVYFVEAEFLYWIVNEGVVDYAIKMHNSPWSTTQPTHGIGQYHKAQFDWTPGFRVSAGYFNAPHYWDVFAQYAFLHVTGDNRTHAPSPSDEYLNGTWTQPGADIQPTSFPLATASSHIDLQYNVLDFMFSRRFQTNPHLRLNVFGGLTSALIFQKWYISYLDTANQHSALYNRFRFEGIGLRLGTKLDWYMGCDIYLTGIASTAVLSGWYKNSSYQNTTAFIPGTNNELPFRDTHFRDNRLTYTIQTLAGLSWQKRFCSVRAEIFAGYEMTLWTNILNIYRSAASLPTGPKETTINTADLCLQGLTVRAGVDF